MSLEVCIPEEQKPQGKIKLLHFYSSIFGIQMRNSEGE